MAMRDSAACGSPCEPVQMHTTSCAGIAAHVAVADLHAGRNPQVAEPLRDLRVVDHAAADERELAIELRGEVGENLHPVDARREHRDDDLALRAGEDLLEGVDDFQLRAAEPAPLDVGAVGEQHVHAGGAELRDAVKIDVLAVERRLIDLEVAGVHDHAARRLDGQRDAVGHAVRDAQELDDERADGDALARLDAHQPSP